MLHRSIRLLRGICVATGLTLIPSPAAAQFSWSNAAGGVWSVGGNWGGTGPTAGGSATTTLTFGLSSSYTATDDLGGAFSLNALTFSNAAGTTVTLAPNTNDSLNFTGTNPTISLTNPGSAIISLPATLGSNLTASGSAPLTFSGAIGGSGSLTYTGSSTLTLGNPANTFGGGTIIQSGTVQVAADGALGTGSVTIGGFGNLLYTGSTTTSRTVSNSATLTVAAGQTLTMSGAQVEGGFLVGPGTISTSAATGAIFAGTTIRPSLTLNSNSSSDQFINVTNGGILNVASGLTTAVTLTGTTNSGSGSITIGGSSPVNVIDFQSSGTLTLANGSGTTKTLLTNTGSTPLYFNGGSRTFIGAVGGNGLAQLELNGQNAIVANGLLVNNGHVSDSSALGISTIVADYGALVKGAGLYDNPVRTINGGRFQSGNSPGVATFGSFVFGPGGVNNYIFAISNATGQAGPTPDAHGQVSGWGLVKTGQWQRAAGMTSGNFTWTADASDPLTISLETLLDPTTSGTDPTGLMANFHPNQPYSWLAAEWMGTYTGPTSVAALDAATTFDTSEFANPIAGTFGWNIDPTAGTLSLTYSPSAVPEPGTLCLTGLAGLSLGWTARRRARRTSRSAA
jgi:fibronectin-binding autotransporter adhesin